MKFHKYRNYTNNNAIGATDFGGFISILQMDISCGTFSGVRVRKDKRDELVAALCCVYSGVKKNVTVANGSPDFESNNIVVNRSGYDIHVSKEYSWSRGLCFSDKVALPLIQLLEPGCPNGTIEVEHFIKPVNEDGLRNWIFILNFGNRVAISILDEYDHVQGMIIPMSSIHTVSNKLLREYNTRKKNWASNSQFDMANPYGRGKLVLPGSDSILFVGETLRNIYDSQWI